MLSELLSELADPALVLDRAFRVRCVNPAFERLVVKSSTELSGRLVWEIIPASPDLPEALGRCLAEQVSVVVKGPSIIGASPELHAYPSPRMVLVILRSTVTRSDAAEGALAPGGVANPVAAEEALRLLASSTGVLLWYADVEDVPGDGLVWSIHVPDEECARRTFPVAMAPGKSYVEAVIDARLAEDAERFDEYTDREIRAGRDFRAEFRICHVDGRIRWVLTRASVALVSPGKWQLSCMSVDLTERKEAEERLRASEKRFRQAFDNAPIGMAIGSLDYRLIDANPAFCSMLGYGPGELNGLSTFELTHPDERELKRQRTDQIIWEGLPDNTVVKRYIGRDGETVWVNLTVTVARDEDNQPLYVLAMMESLAERKAAEENQALLASIVESSIDPIIAHSLDGSIISWNSAAEKLYGYSSAEAMGRSVMSLPHPDRRAFLAAQLQRAYRGEAIDLYESVSVRKDGRSVETLVRVSPIKNSAGEVIGAATTVHDMTQMKETQRERDQQTKRLSAIRAIDATIIGSFDLQLVAREIVRQVCATLSVHAAALFVLDQDSRNLERVASYGFRRRDSSRGSVAVGEGVSGAAALSGRSVLIHSLAETNAPIARNELLESERFVGYAAIPLNAKGHASGVLQVLNRAPLTFTEDDWEFLKDLAAHAAVAVDNARMFDSLRRAETRSLSRGGEPTKRDGIRPLTPALCNLLQTAIRWKTTETATLAGLLCCSPTTVHTYWQRICTLLGADARFQAVMIAVERGLVQLSDSDR